MTAYVPPYSPSFPDWQRQVALALNPLFRRIDAYRSWADFGIVADGVTDDTAAVQKAFDSLSPGSVLIMPSTKIKINSTITLGNGTTTSLSTTGNNSTIIWGGESSNANALIDTSDPWYSTAQSGTQFVWGGTAGGTMFKIAGPIQGLRWVGALTLNGGCVSNGGSGAGACFEARSFSSCTMDTIVAVNWQASGRGVLISNVSATSIGGNVNPIVSGGNRIGRIFAHSPYGSNGECVRIDGYRVAGGADFTVSTIGIIECGISGTNAKGLIVGYVDDCCIHTLVNTTYGTLSGTPFGLYLDSTTVPFNTPARVYIHNTSVGQGLTVGGGTNAQVIIENYEMDDGGLLPTVTGLNIRNICRTGNSMDQMAYPPAGKSKTIAISDGQGLYGYDTSGNHIHSITRRGVAAHVAGFGDVEFEAGATGGPTTAKQFSVKTTGPFSDFLSSSASYANDAAAATGGVPVGGFYRNGSIVQIRIA